MSLIQNTFLTDEQHQQVARYLAECTDEQAQRLPELLRYMEYDLSLSYQLGRLSKPELDRIRQATSLKRASRLNKADLVTALEQWLPSQLMQSLSLLDGRGFALLKSLLAQQYVKPYEFEYDFRLLTHLQNYGLAFTGFIEGLGYAVVISQGIANELKTLLVGEQLDEVIRQNDAVLHMARGLLEYYGIFNCRSIEDQVEAFVPAYRMARIFWIIFDLGLETGYFTYWHERSRAMLVHPAVVNPEQLWQQQQSKLGLDYRAITRAEALRAGQDRRGLWNVHHRGLVDFLFHKGMNREDALQAVDTCFRQLRNGNRFVEVVQEVLELVVLDNLDEVNQCARYVMEINNSSATWQTKGYAPREVRAPEPLMSVPDEPFVLHRQGVGRNEPCPCGSGKKYKKCCGANR